jgi:hypothetical protein
VDDWARLVSIALDDLLGQVGLQLFQIYRQGTPRGQERGLWLAKGRAPWGALNQKMGSRPIFFCNCMMP